jgi:V-type H+-transporting ATPase subunit C
MTTKHNVGERSGSLLVRTLGDVVKPSHFVLDSEYLVTLVVVVPKCGPPRGWPAH